jgi:HAD superfamily hydrolase (TIGR01509 family)
MTKMSAAPWPIRSVVFDLDGLLIDTEPIFEEAARILLARRNKSLIPEVMRAMMGAPAREVLPLFRERHQLSESLEELASEYRDCFFAALGEQPVKLLPGALTLLDRLERKGMPRAIATSSTARYVERILTPHRLVQRFHFVLSADDVARGKPDPEIYRKAAGRFGHAPAEMLVLEDSVNGLRAAKAAGARCVVVPHALVDVNLVKDADAIVPALDAPQLFDMLELSRS